MPTASKRSKRSVKKQHQPCAHSPSEAAAMGDDLSGFELADGLCPSGKPCLIQETERRGISLKQLVALVKLLRSRCSDDGVVNAWKDTSAASSTYEQPIRMQTMNLYHLNSCLIMPATSLWSCSFVELISTSAEEQLPEYFVSHWWGEPIVHFVMCLQRFSEARRLQRPVFWVCAYANNQHSLHMDVSADPSQSSFRKAMEISHGTVLVLDSEATPFSRVWCTYEIFTTLQDISKPLDIVTFVAGGDDALPLVREAEPGGAQREVLVVPGGRAELISEGFIPEDHRKGEIFQVGHVRRPASPRALKAQRESSFPLDVAYRGYGTDIVRARASVDMDRVHILNCIAASQSLDAEPPKEHSKYREVNCTVRSRFAVAVIVQAIRSGDEVAVRRSVEAICQDHARTEIDLHVPGSPLSDDMLRALLEGLHAGILTLGLGLGGTHVSDASASGFREALQRLLDLQSFNLYVNSQAMTDAMPIGIAQGLASARSLRSLTLYFTSTAVGDAGAAALAAAIRGLRALANLQIGLSYTAVTDAGVASLADGVSLRGDSLAELGLTFNNTQVGSGAAAAIARALPRLRQTHNLWLGFYRSAVDDAGAASVHRAAAEMPALKDVFIDFKHSAVEADDLQHVRSAAGATATTPRTTP